MLIPSRNEYRFSWVHPTPETKKKMESLMMKRDPQELPLPPGNGRGEYRIQKVVGGFLHRQLFTFVSTFLGWEASNRQNKKYRTDWWGWIMATTQDFREYITQNQQAF